MTWKHQLEQRTDWRWEHRYGRVDGGLWYVVEHGGMLHSGPFKSKEQAKEWFKKELEVELVEDLCGQK